MKCECCHDQAATTTVKCIDISNDVYTMDVCEDCKAQEEKNGKVVKEYNKI